MVGRRARANLWPGDRYGVLIFSTVDAVPDPRGKCRLDRFLHDLLRRGKGSKRPRDLIQHSGWISLVREPAPPLDARVTHE